MWHAPSEAMCGGEEGRVRRDCALGMADSVLGPNMGGGATRVTTITCRRTPRARCLGTGAVRPLGSGQRATGTGHRASGNRQQAPDSGLAAGNSVEPGGERGGRGSERRLRARARGGSLGSPDSRQRVWHWHTTKQRRDARLQQQLRSALRFCDWHRISVMECSEAC